MMKDSNEKKTLLRSSRERAVSGVSKLSNFRKFFFGIGGAASVMPNTVLGFYLQIFLLETAELSPGYASVVIFVGKLWDAVTDPMIGYLSSKTNTKMGRMRPWLLFSALPMVAAYVAIWIVPPGGQAIMTIYYTFLYCGYQTFLSCFHVPYTALTMYLSIDSKERDSATAFRMVSEVVGTLIGAVAQALSISLLVKKPSECVDYKTEPEDLLSAEKLAYLVGGGIVGFLMLVCALSPFLGVKEVKDTAVRREPLSFFKGLRYTFKQRPFVYLMMIYLCAWLMVSLVQTNLALYVQYVLDMESQFQYVIILLLVVVVFSIPMWQLFLLRFGKKTTYATGITLVLPALFAFLYIGADDNYVVWPLAVISGIGIGSAYLVPWSMLPDAIDEAAARDGVRRESLFYAFFVFWQKFSTGIALALSTLALQVFGDYKTGQCNQPLSVSLTLRLLISTGPILLIILSFYFTWRYPITETKRWEIKQTLESRRNENATKSYQTSTNRTSRGKKPAEQSDAVDGMTSDTNVDTSSEVSGLPDPQTL